MKNFIFLCSVTRLKNVRVKIDLTKRRYEVLKKSITLVNGNNVDHVFTDVNYQLKVVFKDKRSSFLTILMI